MTEKQEHKQKLFKFFMEDIWDEREDDDGFCKCFESGLLLHRNVYRDKSTTYHHILEKSIYPEYEFETWNIKILHPAIHNQVGYNLDKTPKVKTYKEHLLKLHEKGEL
jgi:5-methylcytosine-specific restriction endonuclease McrA